MNENPYAAPAGDVSSAGAHAGPMEPASSGTRLANLLLDMIGYYVCIFIVGFLTALLSMPFVGGVAAMGVLFGYHLFFEALFARTPAKWLTRTMVVTVDGGRPSFGQILGRSLIRYIPFEPFSFLGTPAVGWHDSWSGTRVIKVR